MCVNLPLVGLHHTGLSCPSMAEHRHASGQALWLGQNSSIFSLMCLFCFRTYMPYTWERTKGCALHTQGRQPHLPPPTARKGARAGIAPSPAFPLHPFFLASSLHSCAVCACPPTSLINALSNSPNALCLHTFHACLHTAEREGRRARQPLSLSLPRAARCAPSPPCKRGTQSRRAPPRGTTTHLGRPYPGRVGGRPRYYGCRGDACAAAPSSSTAAWTCCLFTLSRPMTGVRGGSRLACTATPAAPPPYPALPLSDGTRYTGGLPREPRRLGSAIHRHLSTQLRTHYRRTPQWDCAAGIRVAKTRSTAPSGARATPRLLLRASPAGTHFSLPPATPFAPIPATWGGGVATCHYLGPDNQPAILRPMTEHGMDCLFPPFHLL